MFLTSTGKAALSLFRLEKLRTAVKAVAPGLSVESTQHWYFMELSSALSEADKHLLERLLGSASEGGKNPAKFSSLLVVPRLGTQSLERVRDDQSGRYLEGTDGDQERLTRARRPYLLRLTGFQ